MHMMARMSQSSKSLLRVSDANGSHPQRPMIPKSQTLLHDRCSALPNRLRQTPGGDLDRVSPNFVGRGDHVKSFRSPLVFAQRRRPVEDDVELDDGDFSGDGEVFTAQGFSLGGVLGQAWSALLSVTDRLTDIAYDYVPADVSRSTVNLAVKAGLLLVLIGFARSILGFLLTVGTLVLGLFVASRVLGIEAGSGGVRPKGKKKGKRWGSGGSRRPPPQRPQRRLPSGVARDSDTVDVWFDTRDKRTDRRRSDT